MINQRSIDVVDQAIFSKHFRHPLYDSYCFSNVPQTILSLFGIGNPTLPQDCLNTLAPQYDQVVLFFVDAFGWRFFERQLPLSPFLQQLAEGGVVSKLTSQFPSTTTAHVTTMNTGSPVGDHGLYEWNYYEPKLHAVIHPLLYSYAGDTTRNTIADSSIDPASIFPTKTIFKRLKKHNVPSHIYQSKMIMDGSYSQAILDSTIPHGYTTLAEGLINLVNQVNLGLNGYHYFYYSEFDTVAHNYGPNSPQADAQIQLFFHALENFFYKKISQKQNVLTLIIADHGQVEVSPQTCFYLNLDAPEIIPHLKTLPNGQPIIPAGSPRDFFLHVEESKLEITKTILTKKLQGSAEVYLVQDLINQGFFGPTCSQTFLSRVGNLVILPHIGQTVWWFEKDKFWQRYHGHHGGLTPQEMDIPLIIYPLT